MAKIKDVNTIFEQAAVVFAERHAKYGTTGMDVPKALSLAETKLDRVRNAMTDWPAMKLVEDSLIDLMNYAVIMLLLERGQWETVEGTPDVPEGIDPSSGLSVLIKRNEEAKRYPLSPPRKAGDCGYDLHTTEPTLIPAHSKIPVNVPTGVAVKIPEGFWVEIKPRSSTNKRGLTVVASVVDSGYTGPIYALAHNTTDEDITVQSGERIAQMIIHDAHVFPLREVDELPTTERGASGFGSTGS